MPDPRDARIAELEAALKIAATCMTAHRTLMENLSDGASRPAMMTIKLHHDAVSMALAECDRLGIFPDIQDEPD